ncbi:hypothetical protein [Streptomyces lydicus]|uniref:hypothetical protein n=1 Tax=Streptomyces lydicus TaxID=47763 RepID=UPI0010131798|nr:hypothetical protein [Streptomyces lydicus]MCZ1005621.1 hypothetical protein [Streptomyces lydicus]
MLTEAGRRRLRAATAAQQAVEGELFRSLTDAQRSLLTRLLVLVRDDLTDGDAHCVAPASPRTPPHSPW